MYNLFENKDSIFQDFEQKGVSGMAKLLDIASIRNVLSRNG